jgi:hypothetical protein
MNRNNTVQQRVLQYHELIPTDSFQILIHLKNLQETRGVLIVILILLIILK